MPLRENTYLDRYGPVLDPDAARPLRQRSLQTGDTLLKRAALLLPDDRNMLELSIHNGASYRALGRMLNVPAGTIARRVRRLITRLHDPLVVALCEPALPLPPEYRQLGIEHFLQGQSMLALAELHQMPLPHVKRIIEHIKGWHRGMTVRQQAR